MTRRELLALIPALPALAVAAPGGVHVGCQTNAWPIKPGQVETLLTALKDIRQLGFEGFETGFRNLENATAQQLAASSLAFFATHIFLNRYDPGSSIAPWDLIAVTADRAASLGAARLILSGAPVGPEVRAKASALNRAGEYCRSKRLRLAYHNHSPEFTNGAQEITALMAATDPQLVHFVLDAGHAMRTGINLAGFFSKHHSRIDGMHLRDFKQDQQVPLGSGGFDYQPLAAAVRKAGWSGWVLAEEERLGGEKLASEAAGPARETIRRLFGT